MAELTEISKEKSEIAFSLLEQLKNLLRQQGFLFLETGKLLKQIRDGEHYTALGYDMWLDFLNGGEIAISKSTAYAYINIFEVYIEKHGLDYETIADIPWDKLSLALPSARKVDNKNELEEIIEQARVLSRTDLRLELSEKEVLTQPEVKTRLIKVFKHDKCGKWFVDLDHTEICTCKSYE